MVSSALYKTLIINQLKFQVLVMPSLFIVRAPPSFVRSLFAGPSLRQSISTKSVSFSPPWRPTEHQNSHASRKVNLHLSRMQTMALLRSWFLAKVLRTPILFNPGLACLRAIANSEGLLLDPDRNLLLRWILKPLIYDQFCAGTTNNEVRLTVDGIKSQGYTGVILSHAKEIHPNYYASSTLRFGPRVDEEIQRWRDRNLETLDLVQPSDLLGLK